MEDMKIQEEDPHALAPDFKLWLNWLQAFVTIQRCLLKLADKIDCVDAEDEDGTFEDIEIDGEPESVLDIDQLKLQSLRLLNLDLLIELTTPIPHLSAFARVAEDAFDELQETAFAILTSLLFSKLP